MIRPRSRSATFLRQPGAFAFGTLLAVATQAQTPATPDPNATKTDAAPAAVALEAVTVTGRRADSYAVDDSAAATKLTLSPRETPQSMTVVTRERLDDQALTSLRQVLDNTPGLYSSAYDSERVLFYSRGFVIDSLMYDGVPALSNFDTGSIDETIEMSLYDRVEVVRGATGLMTGAGSPAASINLVRKHADSKTPTASFDLSVGSWQDERVEIDASTPLTADGRIRARGVAVAEDRDSYQALYNKKTYVLYGIVDADITPATRVSLGFDYQDNRPTSNTWGSFPLFLSDGQWANWPRSVTTATNWAYWNRKTQSVFGEVKHEFDNGWQLRSSLSHREFKEDVSLFYVSGYPDPVDGMGLIPYAYRSRNKITQTALDLYASGPFELLGRQHEIVLGYNGSRAKNTGTENATVGDLAPVGNFFQWEGNYPHPAFADSTPLSDIKTNQDAIYGVARFSLAESLKLITGARYARWSIDSFYIYDVSVNSKYEYSKLVPYAGLVWDFAPQLSAFTSYTSIFKPQNNRNSNGQYLDPVQGRSIEAGIKGEFMDRRLNTSLTIFETRQKNIATALLDPVTGDNLLLPDGSSVYEPIDSTRTRGFEVEATGKLGDQVQGSIGWTRNITKDGSGNTIRTFIPGTMLKLFATWEPRTLVRNLTLGGGVNWQSDSSTTVGSPNGPTELRQGSVTQVSLMAKYQWTPQLAVQFNAENVFDRRFYVLDDNDNTYYGSPAKYALSLRLTY